MKKVLYIINIEVPYRTVFFNELAKHCDLTVLYERDNSALRDKKWSQAEDRKFKFEYLNGIPLANDFSFSLGILKYLKRDFDAIIFGCFNSMAQIFGILTMRMLRKPFYINLDGEPFIGTGIKSKIKTFVLDNAKGYFVFGEKACVSLKNAIGSSDIYPNYFSSLSDSELEHNREDFLANNKKEQILVVGQLAEYKGLDTALKAAKLLPEQHFKFVGMGVKLADFNAMVKELQVLNVEAVPFLQKNELMQEYKDCKMLVLPSRQECWGLVINEAASFGTPIISSRGAGAGVEYLAGEYEKFLFTPGDEKDLKNKINLLLGYENIEEYKTYLVNKSKNYSVENSVKNHLDVLM